MSEPLVRFLEAGGRVGALLLVLGVYLWTALLLRAMSLARGDARPVQDLLQTPPRRSGALREAIALARACAPHDLRGLGLGLAGIRRRLPLFRRTVRTLCATAPMLGLLGTVSGMIQTFDALGAAGGKEEVAAGISQALLTTELGLALAIPGLLLGRLLDGRQARLARELDEVHARTVEAWGQP